MRLHIPSLRLVLAEALGLTGLAFLALAEVADRRHEMTARVMRGEL